MDVIATAGHVDHGKSALVRALTGMEPDRWTEERRRGLTLDLGFAWTATGGRTLAFVDVPGHERFVPNMLAGVGPAPAVLFVVAADEGWMPQSAEHLAALHAHGVRHGLLVVTKADIADPAPARDGALAELAGTTLADMPSVAVSARTGLGLDRLHEELESLAASLPTPDLDADVRLWVDRVFSVRGAGTVATGTLAGGTLRLGDELVVSRTGHPARVRGLHVLGESAEQVAATARVAVNLRGTDRAQVERGDALLTPERWRGTREFDVALHACDPERLHRHLVLHVGTADVPVHVRPLGAHTARLLLEASLPLRVSDTGLLRDPGEHRIAAGFRVLDVDPPSISGRGLARRRGALLAALAARRDPVTALAEDRLARLGQVRAAEFRVTGLPVPGSEVEGWQVDTETWIRTADRARAVLTRWDADHGLAAGMPIDELRRELDMPSRDLAARLAENAGFTVVDGRVRSPSEQDALPRAVEDAVRIVERGLAADPFRAPEAEELARFGLGTKELAAAVRLGRLTRVADGVVLGPGALSRAAEVLAGLDGEFSVSEAKRALDTTRRVAIPLLEQLDAQGITERITDTARRCRAPRAAVGEDTR
ncbi:selenocysteine-specific translation elongation factor [Allosaccharopolyspora coralli]|uniref:Selenocysteine-specific elongation factor n=1 Tax=Allosaccharopolyspora coralli TaxID=2665642 RepID=A0A5Q3QB81_9PSEU|nr:selenocysteine-specific translation elongation factor [Allosaccharopolyspora coralli]QGK70474.1 selenocysteine-specific translation elongation factor [Allosaccharopolyspora coralli]